MLLSNEQLNGKSPVVVKNTNAGGKEIIESESAFITKVHQGDRQGVLATVRIGEDIVERWIFASDQKSN